MGNRPKGIYCLESGEWFDTMKKKHSVEPILQFLRGSPLAVPYIHRDIATDVELRYYLRKWLLSKHRDYPILYLAFHGSPGGIHLAGENGRKLVVGTDELFELLRGRCRRRLIHLGSCSVLNLHSSVVERYLRESRAVAISGFADDVEWVNSSVLEMLYFAELQNFQLTKAGIDAVRRRLARLAGGMRRRQRFVIRTRRTT